MIYIKAMSVGLSLQRADFACRKRVDMLASLLFTAFGFAALAKSATVTRRAGVAQITCYPAIITNGTLFYGTTTAPSYTSKIGVVDAYGNAPLLAKYPSQNVNSLKVNVVPCSSTYLDYTVPTGCTDQPAPVLIYAADGSNDCLQLQSSSSTNVFIVKQSCSKVDGAIQLNQFWTQNAVTESYLPAGSKQPAASWNLQFNEHSNNEVFANPPTCPKGDICQAGSKIAFYIQQ